MTDEQRAAVERLRKDDYGKSEDFDYTDAGWWRRVCDEATVSDMYLAEHPADCPSLADELREARYLLAGCRHAMVFSDQQRINVFLDRTAYIEQEPKHD